MNKFVLAATLMIIATGSGFAQSTPIFEKTEIKELEGQDIDANVRLLEALTRAAKKGPRFRLSPDKVFMDLVVGSVGAQTVRVSNVGDEDGRINGINAIGSIEGLSVTDNCPEVISPGGYCDIAVRFESSKPQAVQTVVVVSIKERDRSSFDVPLQIEVKEPVVEVDTEAERRALEEANRPPTVVLVRPEEPEGPTSKQVAGRYFAGLGSQSRQKAGGGIVRVSRPESLKAKSVSGISYSDVESVVETTAGRYDAEIASVEASLPVNRDKILTSDRVIKAVLDTPVSNIMCGKVVAVIESDVYSATGQNPLIPAGSRAIGRCGQFAEERVGIAWSRIITTDGRSISFDDGSVGTNDASGLGGALGRVYRSNFDRFVLPIISTMVDTAAGVVFATFGENESVVTTQDGSVVQENSPKNEGLRIVTGEARSTAQDLISEIRDVREVMVLPAGSRIDIEISQDIYFKNEREVVRLGDTRYIVESSPQPLVKEVRGQGFILVPYRAGMVGPVVTVDGRRFIVSESVDSEGEVEEEETNEVVSDLSSGGTE